MKIFLASILIFTFSSFNLHAQDSISVSDFRFPETRAIDLKAGLNGSFDGNHSNTIQSYQPFISQSYRSENGNYSADAEFFLFHSKEDLDNTVNLNTSYTIYRRSTSSVTFSPSSPFQLNNESDNRQLNIGAGWNYARYGENAGFHFLGVSAMQYSRTNHHDEGASGVNSSQYFDASNGVEDNLLVSSYWGLGYGRIREGSFVTEALRIIDKLKEDGLVASPLTHDQWLSLIDRVAHRREYTTNFERYQKNLGGDIVDELVASGVIAKNAMTAYTAIKLTEAFTRPLQTRFFGWRIYDAVGPRDEQYANDADYFSVDGAIEQSSNSHYFEKYFAFVNTVGGEWGYPLSLYTHVYASAHIEIPARDPETMTNLYTSASVSYELGERVSLTGSYIYSDAKTPLIQFLGSGAYQRILMHQLQGSATIYLEDLMNLTTSIGYTSSQMQDFYSGFYSQYRAGFTAQFGVRFNII